MSITNAVSVRFQMAVLLALVALGSTAAKADEVVLINDPVADGLFTEDGVTGYQYIFDFYWGDSSLHTASPSTCIGQCLGYSSEFAIGGSVTPFDATGAAWYRQGDVSYTAWNKFAGGGDPPTGADIVATFPANGVMQGWYETNVTTSNPADYHPLGPFGCQAPGCPYANWNLPAATGLRSTDAWDTNVTDDHGSFGATAGSTVPWAMENTWHVPSDYSYSTLELAPASFFGGSSFNGGAGIPPTQGLEISSQIDQWQGPPTTPLLLATLRVVHPNAPGTMQWFSADGYGFIQGPTGDPVVINPCVIGDANCDGYVDIGGDILPGFSNFTGPGSFGKTRVQGDVEGSGTGATTNLDPHDGDVDVSDLLTMFGNFTGPPPDESGDGGLAPAEVGDPSIPDLIYDAATGEVTLDVDGSGIIGYVLKNGAGTFVPGNHTPILGGVTTSLAGELSEAALSSPGGANSIGFVFPTGMNLAALTAYLTTNEVSRSLGAPIVPFDLVVLSAGPPVPEPATLVISALALVGMGLIAYRRRAA